MAPSFRVLTTRICPGLSNGLRTNTKSFDLFTRTITARELTSTSGRGERSRADTNHHIHRALGMREQAPSSTPARFSRARQQQELRRWRLEARPSALRKIAARARSLRWSRNLVSLVLYELGIDHVAELIGPLRRMPPSRYPQAIAVSIALRHSWRPDDLARIARRLHLDVSHYRSPRARRQGARLLHASRIAR